MSTIDVLCADLKKFRQEYEDLGGHIWVEKIDAPYELCNACGVSRATGKGLCLGRKHAKRIAQFREELGIVTP